MMRVWLLLTGLILWFPAVAAAQSQPPAQSAPPALTPQQARAALDVLNNPQKRADVHCHAGGDRRGHSGGTGARQPPAAGSVSRRLPGASPLPAHNAPPAAAPACQPTAAPAKPAGPAADTLKIPLAPDSLGAQVLVSAANFLNRAAPRP